MEFPECEHIVAPLLAFTIYTPEKIARGEELPKTCNYCSALDAKHHWEELVGQDTSDDDIEQGESSSPSISKYKKYKIHCCSYICLYAHDTDTTRCAALGRAAELWMNNFISKHFWNSWGKYWPEDLLEDFENCPQDAATQEPELDNVEIPDFVYQG